MTVTPPYPTPALGPEAALRAVLDGLIAADASASGHGTEDGAEDGAQVLHAFASERMRASIGDVDAFRRALGNSLYAPLRDAEQLVIEGLERRGDSARATVVALAPDGEPVRFTVALARATRGERSNCWLVGGVAREGVDL